MIYFGRGQIERGGVNEKWEEGKCEVNNFYFIFGSEGRMVN